MTGGLGEERARRHVLHELRTPLSVIKGSLVALAGHWDRIEEERRSELLRRASVNVDRLAAAISELGGTARPGGEGGGPALTITAIEVARVTGRLRVQVSVAAGEVSLVGRSESGWGRVAERRAVAEAVVAAVDARAQVEDAEVIDVGGDQVGVVRLSRGGTSLMGAALKFADEYDAVAHATLHALRRTAEMSAPPEPGSR